MARTNNPTRPPRSSSSTSSTTAETSTTPGGGYAVFGKVIDGMEVVDKIAKVATGSQGGPHDDVPVKPVYIKSAKRKAKS